MGSAEIEPWLNDRLFYRPDLHPSFKDLHKCGADLEYVLFLCKFFCIGNDLQQRYRFTSQRGVFRETQQRFKRAIEELPPVESCQTPETISAGIEIRKAVIAGIESMEKIGEFLIGGGSDPLTTVLVDFCFPPRLFNERGRPADLWGSFFLLVVTDHLQSTGKQRPNHRLAYRLLAKLRKDSSPIDNPRQNVATRIKQLQAAASPELCAKMVWALSYLFREVPDYCKRFVDRIAPAHLEFPALESPES